MDCRIECIDFELRFAVKRHTVKSCQGFKTVPALWRNAKKDGFRQSLIDMAWVDPKCRLFSLVGVCGKEAPITAETFDYFMGVRFDREIPEGMEELIIPPSLYAVFANTLNGWQNQKEWLSSSEYELSGLPFIEHFLAPGQKPRHELWVSVERKKLIMEN